jgi:hypothetical protein
VRERCREAETGRGYAAGRCCTRALLCTGRTGWYYCASRKRMGRTMARTNRGIDRRLAEMLCRLQSRDGKKAMIVHAKLSEMARLQATGKAKAQQRARAWELGCSWLCVVLWWLRVREKLWRGTTVLDCRSSLRAFLAALPSIRRSRARSAYYITQRVLYLCVCVC